MVGGGWWINPLQTLPQGLVFTFDFWGLGFGLGKPSKKKEKKSMEFSIPGGGKGSDRQNSILFKVVFKIHFRPF